MPTLTKDLMLFLDAALEGNQDLINDKEYVSTVISNWEDYGGSYITPEDCDILAQRYSKKKSKKNVH